MLIRVPTANLASAVDYTGMPGRAGFDDGSGPLAAAAHWVERLLLGEVGTTLAVLAIAACGFAMLEGRISVRRGLQAVLGCFILFGAPNIAAALMTLAEAPGRNIGMSPPEPAPVFVPPPQPTSDPDPYAGAAVPIRR